MINFTSVDGINCSPEWKESPMFQSMSSLLDANTFKKGIVKPHDRLCSDKFTRMATTRADRRPNFYSHYTGNFVVCRTIGRQVSFVVPYSARKQSDWTIVETIPSNLSEFQAMSVQIKKGKAKKASSTQKSSGGAQNANTCNVAVAVDSNFVVSAETHPTEALLVTKRHYWEEEDGSVHSNEQNYLWDKDWGNRKDSSTTTSNDVGFSISPSIAESVSVPVSSSSKETSNSQSVSSSAINPLWTSDNNNRNDCSNLVEEMPHFQAVNSAQIDSICNGVGGDSDKCVSFARRKKVTPLVSDRVLTTSITSNSFSQASGSPRSAVSLYSPVSTSDGSSTWKRSKYTPVKTFGSPSSSNQAGGRGSNPITPVSTARNNHIIDSNKTRVSSVVATDTNRSAFRHVVVEEEVDEWSPAASIVSTGCWDVPVATTSRQVTAVNGNNCSTTAAAHEIISHITVDLTNASTVSSCSSFTVSNSSYTGSGGFFEEAGETLGIKRKRRPSRKAAATTAAGTGSNKKRKPSTLACNTTPPTVSEEEQWQIQKPKRGKRCSASSAASKTTKPVSHNSTRKSRGGRVGIASKRPAKKPTMVEQLLYGVVAPGEVRDNWDDDSEEDYF